MRRNQKDVARVVGWTSGLLAAGMAFSLATASQIRALPLAVLDGRSPLVVLGEVERGLPI